MVELGDTQRMGLLIGAAAILIFVVVNMAGLLGGGDEKLFIIDLIGIGSMDAMRPDTGFSTQDIVGLLAAAAMGALYFLSAEEELDWEALLGDDDDDEDQFLCICRVSLIREFRRICTPIPISSHQELLLARMA